MAAGYVYLYGAGATLQGGRNLKVASPDMAEGIALGKKEISLTSLSRIW